MQKKKGIESRFFVLFKDVRHLALAFGFDAAGKDRLDYFTAEADERSEPRGRLTLNEVEKLEARSERLETKQALGPGTNMKRVRSLRNQAQPSSA